MWPPCLPDLTTLNFFGGRGEEELCEVNWSAREAQNRDGLMFSEASREHSAPSSDAVEHISL